AFGPYTRTSGPLVQLLRRVGGGGRIVASLQTCVDNVAGEIGHRRKVLGLGEDGADAFATQQPDELRPRGARMARLGHLLDRLAVELARQMIEEAREILLVEFLEGRELPEHGSELLAELAQPRAEEALDEGAGLGERPLLRHEPRSLDRELKSVRRGGGPF